MWGQIKKSINSKLNIPLDVTLGQREDEAQTTVSTTGTSVSYIKGMLSLIGLTNNTGGSASTGSVMAKLNRVLSSPLIANNSAIRSIQQGSQTMHSNTANAGYWINIGAVNVSKSAFFAFGGVHASHGQNSMGGSVVSEIAPAARPARISSTRFGVDFGGSAANGTISWMVIEFF